MCLLQALDPTGVIAQLMVYALSLSPSQLPQILMLELHLAP